MKQAKILLVLLLLVSGMLSAQLPQCDTMTIIYVSSGIQFKNDVLSGADSMITIPFVNHTGANFAYPQAKLVNTTPLPPGMTLYSTDWIVFASAWNTGDTATANIGYNVTTAIPDDYLVTFKLYMTNFAPLSIDSCMFVNTLTVNLKPTHPAGISQVNTPNSFYFYPNPAKDRIEVSSSIPSIFEMYSVSGQRIQTVLIGKQSTVIDLSGLTDGIYFLCEKATGVTKKVVKIN